MSDPTTPTGKRLVSGQMSDAGGWTGLTSNRKARKRVAVAIEREAREPTAEGAWFTVDSLWLALTIVDDDDPNVLADLAIDDDAGHRIAAAIIQAAKEANHE